MNKRHRRTGRQYPLALCGLLSSLIVQQGSAETWSSLPPPPSAAPVSEQNQQYMLGLVVNEYDSNQIVQVTFRNGHYILRAADLIQAGIASRHLDGADVDVSATSGMQAHYDSNRQRIMLTVPPGWLPAQTLNSQTRRGPRYPGRSSEGVLLNYDFYTSHTSAQGTRLSAWNELRLFGERGQFSSNGVWQQQLTGPTFDQPAGYLRYDSWWANENEQKALSWRVGDLTTNALGWSSSVRLGGVQFARDFSVRPDLITYPLPTFAGQAAVPSTVDLFINGYRSSRNQVQPGSWFLTNMPYVNGAGDAVIVTTDAVGRRVTTTLPFYVSSDLLKAGLSDFSLSAGALRQNYGLKSFDYRSAAANGSYRYGLADWLTLESHAETAENLMLGGAGAQFKPGAFGTFNGSLTRSQMSGAQGTQYGWGYQYNNRRFSIGTQQVIRSAEFSNLALYGDRQDNNRFGGSSQFTLSRRSAQYSASLSLDSYGSLGAAYIDITSSSGERTSLWNMSWSISLWESSSLYVSASHDQQQDSWSGAISLVIPFSAQGNASISMERDRQNGYTQRLSLSHAMPSDGGLAWDASWARQSSNSDYRQAGLNWRNNNVELAGGYYGDDRYSTTWGDMMGSLVFMDGHLFSANQVNDAFVLVKTGYPNIKVSYENQLMGQTDERGYLLVPRVSAWYPAKYDIDTLDLPATMSIPNVEQRFSVRRQSGYLLNFPIESLRAANIILQDSQGDPLPVSSVVSGSDRQSGVVGWDGITWLEGLQTENPLRVVTPDGRSCEVTVKITDAASSTLNTYGPFVCALPAPASGNSP
ncbi:fimbrial assembly protein [Izhakiella australiensis]|uniref:Fimbrial assembly protein n=1 Tax=Izhakiella australiensis TaxID=1926881 RepID=A0A1S8YT95_9GAMM|nr:fimbria/pilus outer membrane usher protein [Izhakiella australiensis]OON41967.1 fimbrial assembly protein [Izhakiella australiensis]